MIYNKEVEDQMRIEDTSFEEIKDIVLEHVSSLVFPMDSWLEDNLVQSVVYKLLYQEELIGYAGIFDHMLHYFYVKKPYFKYAPLMLEKFIRDKAVTCLFVTTQDPLFSALSAEWEYVKKKQACWFTDGGKVENSHTMVDDAVFRKAGMEDLQGIRDFSGDFFEEAGGGYPNLEERIKAGVIFVLEKEGGLLGAGIVEISKLQEGITSIGMFANKNYRKLGVAKRLLLGLKQWAYDNGLKPVAGCWYYNTLSRNSLESAGMVATATGYKAIIKEKEALPLRTGNPPGELVT